MHMSSLAHLLFYSTAKCLDGHILLHANVIDYGCLAFFDLHGIYQGKLIYQGRLHAV